MWSGLVRVCVEWVSEGVRVCRGLLGWRNVLIRWRNVESR